MLNHLTVQYQDRSGVIELETLDEPEARELFDALCAQTGMRHVWLLAGPENGADIVDDWSAPE